MILNLFAVGNVRILSGVAISIVLCDLKWGYVWKRTETYITLQLDLFCGHIKCFKHMKAWALHFLSLKVAHSGHDCRRVEPPC